MAPRVVAIDWSSRERQEHAGTAHAGRARAPVRQHGVDARALTFEARRAGVDVEDESALTVLIETLHFTLSGCAGGAVDRGRRRRPSSSRPTSRRTSAPSRRHPLVRAAMRAAQRANSVRAAPVMEGRDIGSAVFPDAPVKLYLVATPEERAGRRVDERGVEGAAGALHARQEGRRRQPVRASVRRSCSTLATST